MAIKITAWRWGRLRLMNKKIRVAFDRLDNCCNELEKFIKNSGDGKIIHRGQILIGAIKNNIEYIKRRLSNES